MHTQTAARAVCLRMRTSVAYKRCARAEEIGESRKSSTMRPLSLLAALFAVLLCARSVQGWRSAIRLPRDVSGTGRYIAVFKDDTSHERLLEIVELLKTSEGCVVHLHMEVALKAIVLNLSDDALQMV